MRVRGQALVAFLVAMTLGGCVTVSPPRPVRGEVQGDPGVLQYVRSLVAWIAPVTEDPQRVYDVRLIRLVPRVSGQSYGDGRISVDADLAAEGYRVSVVSPGRKHSFLTMTLAHEMAHELAGHALSPRASWVHELGADLKAMEYLARLGVPCVIWVDRYEWSLAKGMVGDRHHRVADHLSQARAFCDGPSTPDPPGGGH